MIARLPLIVMQVTLPVVTFGLLAGPDENSTMPAAEEPRPLANTPNRLTVLIESFLAGLGV
jgi:hypothetical protein